MFLALVTMSELLRNAPHFQSWDVRDGLSIASREAYPAVDLRIASAAVEADGFAVATVAPSIVVTLIVERGDAAAQKLDGAFTALIAQLHGLRLKDGSARAWSWLRLGGVRDLEVAGAYAGCELLFTTSSEFEGQRCDC
jgi:hypothetical protein